jgi:HK97 family phage portal protein
VGLRAWLRGDDLLDRDEKALAPPTQRPAFQSWLPGLGSRPPVTVTESNALAVSDAYAAVRLISDAVASLPVHQLRRTDAGRVPVGPDSRLAQLLARPWPGATSCDLFGTLMCHLLVRGNAFVAKYRGGDGQIVQLGLMDPAAVTVELRGQTIVYTVTVAGQRSEHGPEDVLHIRSMSADGLVGLSPVTQCRLSLQLNSDLREHGHRYFRQGSRPGGFITAPGASEVQADALAKKWEQGAGGVENAWKIAVLSGDVTWTPMAFSADDSQFLQQRQLSTAEIARVFGLMPWMLGAPSGDSLTYSTVSEQLRAFANHTLRTWLVRIERAFSGDADLAFDLDGLLRGSPGERAQVYRLALGDDRRPGWLTVDEIRRLEDMEPLPPPQGAA